MWTCENRERAMERAVLPCFQHQSALEPLFGPRWFLVKDTPVQEVGRVGIEGLSKAAVPLCRVPCRASAGPCGSTCARHQQRASASLPFGGSLSLCPRPFGSVLGGLMTHKAGGVCRRACQGVLEGIRVEGCHTVTLNQDLVGAQGSRPAFPQSWPAVTD